MLDAPPLLVPPLLVPPAAGLLPPVELDFVPPRRTDTTRCKPTAGTKRASSIRTAARGRDARGAAFTVRTSAVRFRRATGRVLSATARLRTRAAVRYLAALSAATRRAISTGCFRAARVSTGRGLLVTAPASLGFSIAPASTFPTATSAKQGAYHYATNQDALSHDDSNRFVFTRTT